MPNFSKPKPRIMDYLSPEFISSLTPESRSRLSNVSTRNNVNLLDRILGLARGRDPVTLSNAIPGFPIRLAQGATPGLAAHEGLHNLMGQDPSGFLALLDRDPRMKAEVITRYGSNVGRGSLAAEASATLGQAGPQYIPATARWLYRGIFTDQALMNAQPKRTAGQLGSQARTVPAIMLPPIRTSKKPTSPRSVVPRR